MSSRELLTSSTPFSIAISRIHCLQSSVQAIGGRREREETTLFRHVILDHRAFFSILASLLLCWCFRLQAILVRMPRCPLGVCKSQRIRVSLSACVCGWHGMGWQALLSARLHKPFPASCFLSRERERDSRVTKGGEECTR